MTPTWGPPVIEGTDFKIAAAQIASVRGNIDANVATHAAAIQAAGEHQVSMLVFPELSLTGYEPDLASELAISEDDSRLSPLIALARQHQMVAAVGAPLRNGTGKPAIGAIVITADGATRTYRKMHLGGSERTYFGAGESPLLLTVGEHTVGIAICADSSREAHPQAYADRGAAIYATGVFLNSEWYATDVPRLADYASRYRMLVVMANHAASVGTYTSVGRSAVWSPGGSILVQCEGSGCALLIAANRDGTWRGEIAELQNQRATT
jgi:predicted amidohydrolase